MAHLVLPTVYISGIYSSILHDIITYFHKDFKQKDSIPISISYLDWNGKIAGFSWQHYAKKPLEGTKWTTPDANKALPISPSLASTYNQGII